MAEIFSTYSLHRKKSEYSSCPFFHFCILEYLVVVVSSRFIVSKITQLSHNYSAADIAARSFGSNDKTYAKIFGQKFWK